MGVVIRLTDAEDFEYGFIEETELLRPLIPSLDDESYALLGYLDPYGVTIFNHIQALTLAEDLERVKGKTTSPQTLVLLDRIIELARQCAGQPGLYLQFSGD